MDQLERQGQVPRPQNGHKWKIVVGGKEIVTGKNAVPSSVPISNASIAPFLREADKFSRKHKEAFGDEAAYNS